MFILIKCGFAELNLFLLQTSKAALMSYKFKLILFLTALLPAMSWAQGPCEFNVELPSIYICYNVNGFYLPILSQPTGSYSGEFVSPDGFYDALASGPGERFVIYTADPDVCIGSDTVNFFVMDIGFMEFEGITSICAGDSTTINAPNAVEYDWGTGDRINAYTFSPDSTTTYTVIGTDNTGCPNSAELTITVFQFGADLAISGPSYVCYGDSATYEVIGASTLLWSDGTTTRGFTMEMLQDTAFSVYVGDNPACDTTLELSVDVADEIFFDYEYTNDLCYGELFEIFITGGNASYYKFAGQNFIDYATYFLEDDSLLTLEAYNDSGCVRTRQIQIVVGEYPVLDISAPEQLCQELPLLITVSGAPVIEWLDLNTGDLVALTGENEYSVLASDSIRFQISGASELNCVTTALIEVPIYPAPDVRIDSLTAFCFEREATVIVSGADYYVWNGLNTTPILSFPAVNDTVFTVLGSTIYGCFRYDTLEITVHENPVISLTGESYICELDTATLVGSGASQYFWEGQLGSDTLYSTPSLDTLVELIGKNIFGCADTAVFFVDVDPAPTITFIGDANLCVGDSVSLQVQTDGLVFQWLGGSSQSIIPVDPANDTTYTVTAIGANNCPRTSSFVVMVYDYPLVQVDGNTTICFGDTLVLTASGAIDYFWNNGLTGDSIYYVPVASGILRVDGNSNDCVTQEVLTITVNETPSVQFAFNADTLCTSGSGVSWIASPAGGALVGDGIVNNWFALTAAVDGVNTVSYTFTNASNCSATATDAIVVETCIGLEALEQALPAFYPNPFSDELYFSVPGESVPYEIYNSIGQMMASGLTQRNARVNTQTWEAGTYVVRVKGGLTPATQRVVKL